MIKYKVRPALFGLLWKVVLHANSYDRATMSFHTTFAGAIDCARALQEEEL
ncbi:hypothetical protein VPFG_00247 [Vibrio phage nt-1]|uniref:Uncharacterized protein n=1 Tax=Vibrio phage nt-1 TaxID=115992 RepID=R9TEP4_9CAUD|nr:hypothetical protein VPFG_00247 [Vibrio phage nt-1]AGN30246.1 hypothetical protein VPFG_00247 [Vibrio phage nt-1]